jgi:hypothetical protein
MTAGLTPYKRGRDGDLDRRRSQVTGYFFFGSQRRKLSVLV